MLAIVAAGLGGCGDDPMRESSDPPATGPTQVPQSSTTSPDSGSGTTTSNFPSAPPPTPSQSQSCFRYVACAAQLQLPDADSIAQMYDSAAQCWQGSQQDATSCSAECSDALSDVISALEAQGQEVPASCDPVDSATFSHIRELIGISCVTDCHEPGDTGAQLDLSGNPYGALYLTSSTQSSLLLVDPGFPEDSYLWHKLNGSHGSVSGSGGRMPKGEAAWAQEDIDGVAAWIEAGAPSS